MSSIVFWQAGFLLLLCLSVIGLRTELIPFKAFGGIFGTSLLISLVIGLIILFKFVTGNYAQIQYSLLGLLLTLVIIGGVAYLLKQVGDVPRIHDITTSLTDIPQFTKALEQRKASDNSLAYDEKVASQQQTAYPELSTLVTTFSLGDALKKSTELAKQLGWSVHFIDEKQGIIEATHTSALFGFVDDIIIRIREGDANTGNQTHIDLRSASRVGESDLGANAERIKIFMDLFAQ